MAEQYMQQANTGDCTGIDDLFFETSVPMNQTPNQNFTSGNFQNGSLPSTSIGMPYPSSVNHSTVPSANHRNNLTQLLNQPSTNPGGNKEQHVYNNLLPSSNVSINRFPGPSGMGMMMEHPMNSGPSMTNGMIPASQPNVISQNQSMMHSRSISNPISAGPGQFTRVPHLGQSNQFVRNPSFPPMQQPQQQQPPQGPHLIKHLQHNQQPMTNPNPQPMRMPTPGNVIQQSPNDGQCGQNMPMPQRQFTMNNTTGIVQTSGQQQQQQQQQQLPPQQPPVGSAAPPNMSHGQRLQQPGNQQSPFVNQSAPNAMGGQSTVAFDTDKRKLIQQQLRLLLHAGRCLRMQQQRDSNAPICGVSHCATMRNVLSHMVDCHAGKNCQTPHCASSRQILHHYRICTSKECPVCVPIKQLRQVQQSETQLTRPAEQPVQPQQFEMFNNVQQINGGEQQLQPQQHQQPQHNGMRPANPMPQQSAAGEPTGQWNGPAAMIEQPNNGLVQPVVNGHSWRNNVKLPHRHHLIRRIVQTIFPTPDPNAYKDPRMNNLIEYAKKVEREMFQTATSQEEYFHFLAEKCYKIHKELEEKRRNRQLSSMSTTATPGSNNSSLTSSPRLSMTPTSTGTDQLDLPVLPMRSSPTTGGVALPENTLSDSSDTASLHQFDRVLESEYTRQLKKEEAAAAAGGSSMEVKQEQATPEIKSEAQETPASYEGVGGGKGKGKGKDGHTGENSLPASVKEETSDETSDSNMTPIKTYAEVKSSPSVHPPEQSTWKKWSREELLRAFLPLHKELWDEKDAQIFHNPVDAVALQIPDYHRVVKYPMDLSTIRQKLNDGEYKDPWEVVEDINLMFSNAWLFNKKTSKVFKICTKVSEFFESRIDPLMQKLGFCCGHDYVFLPQVQYCASFRMCPINKDAVYYQLDNTNKIQGLVCEKYLLCEKCFTDPGDEVKLTDEPTAPNPVLATVKKENFVKKKNNVKEREEFVICKHCGRKNHKICVLHADEIWTEGFTCEGCLKHLSQKRKDNRFTAKRLPNCTLGSYLEKRVNDFLKKKKDANAGEVVIRVLSSCDKMVEVKPYMRARFCETGEIAESFPYRLKAIFAFQNIDGVDVCFFGLHVQEYGFECPDPNNRRVYLSYLDSVFYFQPKQYRTDVYHEILVGYLSYVRQLGYMMAHIWACPPSEGDDYIFHMHPPEQKIPKPKRLQEWYNKMLEKSLVERVVIDFKDILRDAFDNRMISATELPYFEGDFWPNTMEEIIKEIEEEEKKRAETVQSKADGDVEEEGAGVGSDDGNEQDKKPCKNKVKKRKAKKPGTQGGKRRKNDALDGMDEVSRKVYEIMEKHKEVFYVIRLHALNSAQSLGKINDPDPLIHSELMDGRDSFLQLARDRHLEFSSHRRTVYSTMIMLYELHTENRSQNFMYTCNVCEKPIETRYHCRECDEYDLCVRCYETEKHPHPMFKVGLGLDDGSDSAEKSEVNMQESKRVSIERSIKSLVHACQCRDANCRIATCQKMQRIIQHSKTCKKKANSTCQVCKQLISLCCYHAKFCQDNNCTVYFCQNIKYRVKQQQQQQRCQQAQMLRRRMLTMKEKGLSRENSQTSLAPVQQQQLQHQQQQQQQASLQSPIMSSAQSAVYAGQPMPSGVVSQGALEAANQAKLMAQMQRFPQAQQQQQPPPPQQQPPQQPGVPPQMMPQQGGGYHPGMMPNQSMARHMPHQMAQAWRPQAPGPVQPQPPTQQQIPRLPTQVPTADIQTVQDILGKIKRSFPNPHDQNKQLIDWLRANQKYMPAYRALQNISSMRPSGSQQPPSVPQQPSQQQWVVQQQQQQPPLHQYQQYPPQGVFPGMMTNYRQPSMPRPQQTSMPPPPHLAQDSRERLPSHFPPDQV